MDREISTSGTLLYTVRFQASSVSRGTMVEGDTQGSSMQFLLPPPILGKVAGVSVTPTSK